MSQELQPLPENPTPQDFGFPENPHVDQLRCWNNQERFLQELAKHGHKRRACEAIGITVWAVQQWDYNDVYSFKKRYQEAKEALLERYEESCDEDALVGVARIERYKNGDPILKSDGTPYVTYERDKLTRMFRMKKLDPSYRDNYQHQTINDNRQVQVHHHYADGPRQIIEGTSSPLEPPENDQDA